MQRVLGRIVIAVTGLLVVAYTVSGLGKLAPIGYFVVTAVMLGVAFAVAIATICTIYCGGSEFERAGGCN